MNTPNKLTVVRIILVPLFVFLLLADFIPYNYLWSLFVFVVASVTDYLDGSIARKRGLVTNFGKFLDPLADKILVISALIIFVQLHVVSGLVVIVILAREFLVTAVRLLAATSGKVIAASFWAKMKTASQMIAIIAILIIGQLSASEIAPQLFNVITMPIIGEILMWVTCIFSIVSGAQYVMGNIEFINEMK